MRFLENELIQFIPFADINLDDPFFDSLKTDYTEFDNWFNKKCSSGAKAFILKQNDCIEAFLYMKSENEEITDVIPPLPAKKRIKLGTMKINPHGTRLGERFIKKALDYAIQFNIEELYVTVFSKHVALVNLFNKYGFIEFGSKTTSNGTELVLIKQLSVIQKDLLSNYPFIQTKNTNKYLLASILNITLNSFLIQF